MALLKGGIRQVELAKRWGYYTQSLNNKFRRGSWSGDDLAKIAEMTGGQLVFLYPDGQQIPITPTPQEAKQEE